MTLNEYDPGSSLAGVVGRTIDESSPAWPRPLRAAPGSPNVVAESHNLADQRRDKLIELIAMRYTDAGK